MSVKQIFNTSAELDYPTVLPTLDLDFANSKTLDPRITFTRASGGSYVGADGLIKYAGVNEARFDHDPVTGESLGLLIEESRTNSLLYSQDFSNAIWSNNLTILLASYNNLTGLDGTTSAYTFTAIPLSGLNAIYQNFTCTASTTYTFSFYVKLGTLPSSSFKIAVFNLTGSSFIAVDVVPTQTLSTSSWTRVSYTFTTPVGCISARVYPYRNAVISQNNGTFYLWGAQLEEGAFPTSYIPTTTAAATRSADVASITGTAFSSWYRQDEGTVFAEALLGRQNALVGAAICGIETGVSNAETIYMHYRGSGSTAFTIYDNSSLQADFSPYGAAVPAGTIVRQCGAYKFNDSVAIGGGVTQTTDSACTMPTPDRMLIGFSTAGNNYLSGTIRRLTYWPARLLNATLQSITQ